VCVCVVLCVWYCVCGNVCVFCMSVVLLCTCSTTSGSLSNSNVTVSQTEIDARAERIASVRDFGLGLIRSDLVRSGPGSKAEIQKALNQLEDAKSELDRAWQHRITRLEQARTLQVRRRPHSNLTTSE